MPDVQNEALIVVKFNIYILEESFRRALLNVTTFQLQSLCMQKQRLFKHFFPIQTFTEQNCKGTRSACTALTRNRPFNWINCGMTFQYLLQVILDNKLFLSKGQSSIIARKGILPDCTTET